MYKIQFLAILIYKGEFKVLLYRPKSNFQNHPFHLVSPSPWPIYTTISLFILTTSTVLFMHHFQGYINLILISIFNVIYSMSLWFRDIISEGKKVLILI